MNTLREKAERLSLAFDSSSFRQRIIVLLAVFIAVHAVWDTFVYQPQIDTLEAAELSLQRERQAIDRFRNQRVVIDTNRINRNVEEVAEIKQQIALLNQQIAQASTELIAPEQIPDVLHELLSKNSKLKVTSLSTKPAQVVNNTASEETATTMEAPVYKHALTLGFEGDYLSTLAYIRDVEKMGWRIFWDSVQIDSSDYPFSRVSISLYTLSLKEGWIGV